MWEVQWHRNSPGYRKSCNMGGPATWVVLKHGWSWNIGGAATWMLLKHGRSWNVGGLETWEVLKRGWSWNIEGPATWEVLKCRGHSVRLGCLTHLSLSWLQMPNLPDKAHPILGIITTIFCILNVSSHHYKHICTCLLLFDFIGKSFRKCILCFLNMLTTIISFNDAKLLFIE